MRLSAFLSLRLAAVVMVATFLGCGGGSSSPSDSFVPDRCDATQVRCDDECVDVSSRSDHCGDCTTMCAGGVSCESGMCGAAPGRCPAGEVFCPSDLDCHDLSSDAARCGSCTNACEANEACTDGRCACAPGFSPCDGACVDLETDLAHCNACNTPCDGACIEGTCTPPNGEVSCGGSICDAATEVCCINTMNTATQTCTIGTTCPPGHFRRQCDDPSDCGGTVCCGQDNPWGALCPPGVFSCGALEELCASASDCPAETPHCCPSTERRACHATMTAGCN